MAILTFLFQFWDSTHKGKAKCSTRLSHQRTSIWKSPKWVKTKRFPKIKWISNGASWFNNPRKFKIWSKVETTLQYVSPNHDLMIQYPLISSIRPTTPIQNKFKPFIYQQVATALPTSSKPVLIRPNAPTTIATRPSVTPLTWTAYVETPKTYQWVLLKKPGNITHQDRLLKISFLPILNIFQCTHKKIDNTIELSHKMNLDDNKITFS